MIVGEEGGTSVTEVTSSVGNGSKIVIPPGGTGIDETGRSVGVGK